MKSVRLKAVDYRHATIEELVMRLGTYDDRKAYTEIYDRFAVLLVSFANRKVDDRAIAMDIVQDTFFELWDKRAAVDPEQDFERYMYRSVRNRIINHYKRVRVSSRYLAYFVGECEKYERSADHLVLYNDLSVAIQKEIDALPERMRVIFELSRKDHLSRTEVALALGVKEGYVKHKMASALHILKNRLGEHYMFLILLHPSLSLEADDKGLQWADDIHFVSSRGDQCDKAAVECPGFPPDHTS